MMAKFSAGLGCIEIFLNYDIWAKTVGGLHAALRNKLKKEMKNNTASEIKSMLPTKYKVIRNSSGLFD